MNALRTRFAPDSQSLPDVVVHLQPLHSYDHLFHFKPGGDVA